MTAATIPLRVGNTQLQVPIIHCVETTEAVVHSVNAKLAAIEEASDRIDSHRFALQAAVHFASELAQLRLSMEEDDRALIHTLDQLAGSIEHLVASLDDLCERI